MRALREDGVSPLLWGYWVFVAVGLLGLTLLQQYWGSLIIRALIKKFLSKREMMVDSLLKGGVFDNPAVAEAWLGKLIREIRYSSCLV